MKVYIHEGIGDGDQDSCPKTCMRSTCTLINEAYLCKLLIYMLVYLI